MAGMCCTCPNPISDRISESGTHGCRVMCEACWLAYHARLAARLPAGTPATVEAVMPLAKRDAAAWEAGALGYGEDSGDDVRRNIKDWLFGS